MNLRQSPGKSGFIEPRPIFYKIMSLVHMYGYIACTDACAPRACSARGGWKSTVSPGTGVTHGSKTPWGCWELNLGPMGDQPVLLTAKPSLHPCDPFLSVSQHDHRIGSLSPNCGREQGNRRLRYGSPRIPQIDSSPRHSQDQDGISESQC